MTINAGCGFYQMKSKLNRQTVRHLELLVLLYNVKVKRENETEDKNFNYRYCEI